MNRPLDRMFLAALALVTALAAQGCSESHAASPDAATSLPVDAAVSPDAFVASEHAVHVRVIGGGVVTPSGGEACGTSCDRIAPSGSTLRLDAVADPGWALVAFEGDCAGAECALVMDQDHDVVVRFASEPDVVLGFTSDVRDLAATSDGGVWIAGVGALATRLDRTGHVVARADAHGIAGASGIASDGDGAWVVGSLRGTGSFEGIDASPGTFFVARLAPDGAVLFARALLASGVGGSCRALAVALDQSVTVACTLDYRVVLTRYAANGDMLWSRAHGRIGLSVGIAPVAALVVDPAGDVFIAGTFDGVVNLGGADLPSAAQEDVFVARYAGVDGAHVWSARLGAADPYGSVEGGTGLMIGPSGDPTILALLATHAQSGGVDLGALSNENAALVRVDASTGAIVSSHYLGGEFAIAVDGSSGGTFAVVAMSRAESVLAARTIPGHSTFALGLDEDGHEHAVNALPIDEDGAGTEWGAIAATPDGAVWMAAPIWPWTNASFGTFTLDTTANRSLLVRVPLAR